MMREGFQEDPLLLPHCFLLQEEPPVSEEKMKTTVMMRKICFSLPPDLGVRQRGILLLGECEESLRGEYAGRWCWAPLGVERLKGGSPSHSLWKLAGEDVMEETQPGLDWSWEKGKIRLITGGVEEGGGCQALVKETAVVMMMGFHLLHLLWLRAEVSGCPIDHLHMVLLQQLPRRHQRPRS